MDWLLLKASMGGSATDDRYRELADPFSQALVDARCTTVNRAAMFVAQVGHESLGLLYFEEIASGAAYEGRRDLGNTQPGDGRRFKGRGPLQVTGRSNYTELSKWAHRRGLVPSASYFVDHPDRLATARFGFLGAVWYWTTRNLNDEADRADIRGATRKINGGLTGLADRERRYAAARRLGTRLLSGQSADPPGAIWVVTASLLNGRAAPSTSAPIVKRWPRGSTLRIVSSTRAEGRRWAQGSGGVWYAQQYLRQRGAIYVVTASLLNGRAAPSTSAPIVKRWDRGTTLRIVATKQAEGRTWAQGSGGVWYANEFLRRK